MLSIPQSAGAQAGSRPPMECSAKSEVVFDLRITDGFGLDLGLESRLSECTILDGPPSEPHCNGSVSEKMYTLLSLLQIRLYIHNLCYMLHAKQEYGDRIFRAV
jgi:hypothetical protein